MRVAKPTFRQKLRELSHAEVEECELAAHAAVPEDATEDEAQEVYTHELRCLVARRQRRAECDPVLDLSELQLDMET